MYQGLLLPDPAPLNDLKATHLNTLTAPLDAYWEEALIGFSSHYQLQLGDRRIGFYCLNGENQLVAFYLQKDYADHAESAFLHVVNAHGVAAALAGTNDPFFFSLCGKIAKSGEVHTLLFQDQGQTIVEQSMADQYAFVPATRADLPDLFEFYLAASDSIDYESIETGFESLNGYVRTLLERNHIFTLREGGRIIAISECRISKTQEPYADLGMIVAREHRRRGIGSFMLARTKAFCYERDLKPICSCEAANTGSKKAINRAGFESKDQVYLFTLE